MNFTVFILKHLCSVLKGHSETLQTLLSRKVWIDICYCERNILSFICLNPMVYTFEEFTPGKRKEGAWWTTQAVLLLVCPAAKKRRKVLFQTVQGGKSWGLQVPGNPLNSQRTNLHHLSPVGKAGAQPHWDPRSTPVNTASTTCAYLSGRLPACPPSPCIGIYFCPLLDDF